MRVALAIVLAVCATAVGVKGASDREPPSDGYEYVTCGSSVKVAHQPTDFRLHSHEVAYGSGSQGQSVTMKKGIEDLNSLWQVTGTPTKACKRGAKVKCGAQIRMLHVPTDKFLHTNPNFQSPLSHNQEVSCANSADVDDESDVWRLECDGDYWEREQTFRLKHKATNMYLHSTGQHQFGRPIQGQREISAYRKSNALNQWVAMEGLYIKTATPKE